MNNFRKLKVWKKAINLATVIYNLTMKFPAEERYGLTAQIRRSAVSVGSNIAEGAGRGSENDFGRFLNIAIGSCYELETQILISKNLKYIDKTEYGAVIELVIENQKMIHPCENRYNYFLL